MHSLAALDQQDEAIVEYYDGSWRDYRYAWMNRRNLAIHFGYWDESTRSHGESLTASNAKLADVAGITGGQRVLDAGCGVGGSSIWLAANRGSTVHGISISDDQVRRASRYARRRGVADRVTFSRQDYRRTDFDDESFDVVWGFESVCHAPVKTDFLREAHRVLRPGGTLAVWDGFRRSRPFADDDEALLRGFLGRAAVDDLDTIDEFVAACEAVGLEPATTVDLTENVAPSLERLRRLSRRLAPIAVVMRRVGLRTTLQEENRHMAAMQYEAFQRGLWSMGIVTATKPAGS